jgi:glycerol-3-phosphate dehydrogenase
VNFDLAVIGGGINGAGIARDAAGRGLKVLLLEQGDLAGATSSASTKLIHGGLRYLEHYEFRLVREALSEREVLLKAAPHLVRPMRFVLPHHAGLRPWWTIRTGLFLYDHLGGRKLLPPTRTLDLSRDPALKPGFGRGFEYSDCWVDDARLVVLTARDAALKGADIRTRTRCIAARAVDGIWSIVTDQGQEERARVLVNAAGPWVSQVLSGVVAQNAPTRIRMVKGSHIVTRRLFEGEKAFIFQNADGRVCFAIPYQQDLTLIGTTDEDYIGDPREATISAAEEAYLLAAVNEYLRTHITAADIVWRYAGVRPLRDDGASKAQEATRDYVLELTGTPPILSVFGGKITTYRRLAEAAMARLAPFFSGLPGPWTARATLPGGNFPWDDIDALCADLCGRSPALSPATARRLVLAYGTDAPNVLGGADLGAGLTEREVDWLVRHEFARTAEDILWRRTKLGLRVTATETDALSRHLAH